MRNLIGLLFTVHCIIAVAGENAAIRCFKARLSTNIYSELILFDDGTYTQRDFGRISQRDDRGTWKQRSADRYMLESEKEMWQLQVGELSVSPVLKRTFPLLSNLRDEISMFLKLHPEKEFTSSDIAKISSLGGPCAEEDRDFCCGTCDGQGYYCMDVRVEHPGKNAKISRSDLASLIYSIKEYEQRKDLNIFHVHVLTHKELNVACWEESGMSWSRHSFAESEVRGIIDQIGSFDNANMGILVQVDCSTIEWRNEQINDR